MFYAHLRGSEILVQCPSWEEDCTRLCSAWIWSTLNWLWEIILVDPLSLAELEAALDLCNNFCPGLDGLRFSLFKALPLESKLCLLDSWYWTKVVPIWKLGNNPALSDLYRPITLPACGRNLMDKMIYTRLDFWAEKNRILPSTQYGFRKGRGTRDCLALLTTDISTSLEKIRLWLLF
jgi:hypothetical protein